jgi:TPR repeat protein
MRRIGCLVLCALSLSCSAVHGIGLLEEGASAFGRKDFPAAFTLFKRAAENGDDIAQGNVAQMYAEGIGVAKDVKRALFWYQKASQQGNDIAQYSLARMYGEGTLLPRDDRRAYFWVYVSTFDQIGRSDEYPSAKKFRELLASRVTASQLKEIEAAAKNWKRKPIFGDSLDAK